MLVRHKIENKEYMAKKVQTEDDIEVASPVINRNILYLRDRFFAQKELILVTELCECKYDVFSVDNF